MVRLKGAFMGYNSLDPPMELWPDARWGNKDKFKLKKKLMPDFRLLFF